MNSSEDPAVDSDPCYKHERKPSEYESEIIEQWNNAHIEHDRLVAYPNIRKSSIDSAINSYAKMGSGDLALGLIDESSLFSSRGVLFTTGGVYWELPGIASGFARFDTLDPQDIALKKKILKKALVFSKDKSLVIDVLQENDQVLSRLAEFVQKAVRIAPPADCWEFALFNKNGEIKRFERFRSSEEVQTAFKYLSIDPNMLYRKYNPGSINDEYDKGEWVNIPETIYKFLHIDGKDYRERHKSFNKLLPIFLGLGVIIIPGVFFIFQFVFGYTPSQTAWILGAVVGGGAYGLFVFMRSL